VGFYEHSNETSGSIKKAGCCLTNWITINLSHFQMIH